MNNAVLVVVLSLSLTHSLLFSSIYLKCLIIYFHNSCFFLFFLFLFSLFYSFFLFLLFFNFFQQVMFYILLVYNIIYNSFFLLFIVLFPLEIYYQTPFFIIFTFYISNWILFFKNLFYITIFANYKFQLISTKT